MAVSVVSAATARRGLGSDVAPPDQVAALVMMMCSK